MSAQRVKIWRAVVAAVAVAIGIGVVWGMLTGWVFALVVDSVDEPRIFENLEIAADGTPVISVQKNEFSTMVTLSRRTLDGKAWPLKYQNWLEAAKLAPRVPPAGLIQAPIPWSRATRVVGGTDGLRPPTSWYFIRDEAAARHAYFAGFDAFSKLPAGYIGRSGFSAVRPQLNDQFELPDSHEEFIYSYLATTQDNYRAWWGVVVRNHTLGESSGPMPQWVVYVAEADKLCEVDLRQRSSRVDLEMPGLVSTANLVAPRDFVRGESANNAANAGEGGAKQGPPPTEGQEDSPNANYQRAWNRKYQNLVALRTDDKIVLFDPATSKQREFVLPKQLPANPLDVYWLAPEKLLLVDEGNSSNGWLRTLYWLGPSGNVQREAQVKLAGPTPEMPPAALWGLSGVVPVSIVWLVGVFIGAPVAMLQNLTESTYGGALTTAFGAAWPTLVFVLALSGVLTWFALRLHRKYRRPATGTWAAFVFLLGLPGFIAYLVEHRRAELAACPKCGDIVPRNREACPDCNTEFALPPRVGTEVFA